MNITGDIRQVLSTFPDCECQNFTTVPLRVGRIRRRYSCIATFGMNSLMPTPEYEPNVQRKKSYYSRKKVAKACGA